jgi:hypothetical protein
MLLLGFSAAVFYWFFRFTVKLIRQHNDINPLLYDLEETEERKKRGKES